MHLQQLLEEASWRLRGYLGAPSTDSCRVGWRRDGCCCPIAEWLLFEAEDEEADGPVAVPDSFVIDRDLAIWEDQVAHTPLLLSRFIDLIDNRDRAPFCGEWSRVDRDEAEAALLQAEREMAQRLLPMQAESVARCDFHAKDGMPCTQPAYGPVIYTFLDLSAPPVAKPQRAFCRLFFGRLCAEHWKRAIVAPPSWWPKLDDVREAVLASEATR